MSKTLAFAAFAATVGLSTAAMAQPASDDPGQAPPATSQAPSDTSAAPDPSDAPTAPPGTDASATASAASISTGMSVKDNTGAIIGEVSGVDAGVATIKMGEDSFTVDTSKLAVKDGAASINATQADIRAMLKK